MDLILHAMVRAPLTAANAKLAVKGRPILAKVAVALSKTSRLVHPRLERPATTIARLPRPRPRPRQRHRQHQILAVAVEGAGATKKAIQIIAAATPVAKERPALFPRGWIHGAAKAAAQGSPQKVNTDGVRHMKGSRGLQLRHLPKRTKNIQ